MIIQMMKIKIKVKSLYKGFKKKKIDISEVLKKAKKRNIYFIYLFIKENIRKSKSISNFKLFLIL